MVKRKRIKLKAKKREKGKRRKNLNELNFLNVSILKREKEWEP